MKKLLAVVVVLAMVSAAQADISVQQVNAGPVATAGGAATQWDVHLVADSVEDSVSAVDLVFTGTYQGWFAGKVPTPTPTEAEAATLLWNPGIDSHFLAPLTAVVTDPFETNNSAYAPGGATTDIEGLGDLGVTAGIVVGSIAQDLLFARIVVLDGQFAYLNGAMSNGQGARFPLENVPIGIPEPVTMLLLAVGAFGVISRRRRA